MSQFCSRGNSGKRLLLTDPIFPLRAALLPPAASTDSTRNKTRRFPNFSPRISDTFPILRERLSPRERLIGDSARQIKDSPERHLFRGGRCERRFRKGLLFTHVRVRVCVFVRARVCVCVMCVCVWVCMGECVSLCVRGCVVCVFV